MLTGKQVINVNIESIISNRYKTRSSLDEKKLDSLAESIKKYGIIEPIILRNIGEKYEIIVGHRRYEACIKLGLKEIPAIIVDMNENTMKEIVLTENMHKQSLSPLEEALSYKKLQEYNHLSIEDISLQVGKDKTYIENKLKLLTLPSIVQEALKNNKISEGHAKLLTKIQNETKQIEILNEIINNRMPVKETEEYINNVTSFNINDDVESTDSININYLNNNSLNIKSALNDLEVVNTSSTTFNDNDKIIEEKKEDEIKMDMNALNQVAQTEPPINPAPQQAQANEEQSRFFPSFDNEPVNMNIEPTMAPNFASTQPTIENTSMPQNYSQPINNVPAQPQENMQQIVEKPVISQPNIDNSIPVQPVPQNIVQPIEFNNQNNNNGQPNIYAPNIPLDTINNQSGIPQSFAPNPQPIMNQSIPVADVANPIPDFRVEPMTPPMPNIEQQAMGNIPVQTPVTVDMTNALINIRNMVPMLESMGYKATMEEQDNPTEYQFIIKIQKN